MRATTTRRTRSGTGPGRPRKARWDKILHPIWTKLKPAEQAVLQRLSRERDEPQSRLLRRAFLYWLDAIGVTVQHQQQQ